MTTSFPIITIPGPGGGFLGTLRRAPPPPPLPRLPPLPRPPRVRKPRDPATRRTFPLPKSDEVIERLLDEYSERRSVAFAVWTLTCRADARIEVALDDAAAFLARYGVVYDRARLQARVSSLVSDGVLERVYGGKVKVTFKASRSFWRL